MKKIGIGLLVVVVAIAGALFWLRGNIDGLVRNAIETYGSEMTKAPVKVAAVEIRPGDGRGVIRGLTIGNPPGFKTAHLLKVAEIEVVIDIASIAGDVVTVKKIAIAAPDIVYEKGEAITNVDALQKNIADYIGPAEKKDNRGGKKLIVEELTVRDAKTQASAPFLDGKTVAVGLPDIALHDLGKSKGGITPGELGQEIVKALKQKLAAAVSFDNLAKSAAAGLDKAGSAIKGLFGK
ncbi:MAG: hypothetical protein Q7U97_08880 [Rhodocyclaceae bacterium]|nr:hypothetical protein [Rhodocyclaceae bacterium]